jgi:ketosteroid isomerase-like protein
MSREHVDIVRRAVAFVAAQDLDGLLSLVDPGVSVRLQIGEVCDGRDAVARWLREWLSTWEDYSLELEQCFDAGDRVVAFICQRGRGRASGVEIDQHPALVFRVRDGQIIEWRVYVDREQALVAAGLAAGSAATGSQEGRIG